MYRKLVAASVIAIAASVLLATPASAAECTVQDQQTTGCGDVTAGVGDEDVSLGIEFDQPGGDAGSGSGDVADDGDTCPIRVQEDRCMGFSPGKTPAVDSSEPITISDIARFRPTAGVAVMQPNGWMLVNLDTNFFSTGGSQIVDGALLGRPAMVRFTPVAWYWSYGDGSSSTLTTPGGSWASQGVAEFDATSGSHIYRAPGTYVIDLSIKYTAEYSFGGGGWRPIAGTLTIPSNRLFASAGTATTVLVQRECTVDPRGPGC